MRDDVQDHRISAYANHGDNVRGRALTERCCRVTLSSTSLQARPAGGNAVTSRYFDAELLKLYLRDEREAKGEVGRLEVDPLYYAQDFEITNFTITGPETVGRETQVTVSFKNLGEPQRLVYILTHTGGGWRISDIRYDDGSSLKKILKHPLVPRLIGIRIEQLSDDVVS
jgi:Protein of unknown function (DUF3828)